MKLGIAAVVLAGTLGASASASAQQSAAQVARGQELFDYWCATCHGPGIGNDGAPYLPGEGALRAKYQGALPALLQERTDMTPELVKHYVRSGITIMPFFRKTEISDADLDAIASYLTRNRKP
jgi:mono/diheme cytochrome c family protein